ncbi:phosphoenolpyruvate--protein phosphotransferase [Breznakiellaceae bacterium SP9]
MIKLHGSGASPGIAQGTAFLYLDNDIPEIPRYHILEEQIEGEWARLHTAMVKAAAEITALQKSVDGEMSKKQSDIFEAHLLMLQDEELNEQLMDRLKSELQNIEWVVNDVVHELMQKLIASPDPYFRDRAVDLSDVSRRVIFKLLSINRFSLKDLHTECILVVHDLLPSDMLTMNRLCVKGLLMDSGGNTSHMAILARAFDIPAVLGLSTITKVIKAGEKIVMNGSSGEVIISPDKAQSARFSRAATLYKKMIAGFSAIKELPAQTLDGHKVWLKANIEVPEEVQNVVAHGAEGIGLYRSEFLFLAPGKSAQEEEQLQAYSRVLKAMNGLPVTIRTVDVGGDKVVPTLESLDEKNPLLGWRAIRFSLAHPQILKMQLRAILRASMVGNVRVMFPMISSIEELDAALALWEESKAECRAKGQPFTEDIKVGIMIEIPSAAITADILAEKVDFFSIGTNDLIQYTIAVDRGNETVNYLAQPCHLGVLRLIKNTIEEGHKKGLRVAICGEMAGNQTLTPLLLGLGLDTFSMVASAIPQVKQIIRSATMEDCKTLADTALQCRSHKQVNVLLDAWKKEHPLDKGGSNAV